jgi:hypothetical protein
MALALCPLPIRPRSLSAAESQAQCVLEGFGHSHLHPPSKSAATLHSQGWASPSNTVALNWFSELLSVHWCFADSHAHSVGTVGHYYLHAGDYCHLFHTGVHVRCSLHKALSLSLSLFLMSQPLHKLDMFSFTRPPTTTFKFQFHLWSRLQLEQLKFLIARQFREALLLENANLPPKMYIKILTDRTQQVINRSAKHYRIGSEANGWRSKTKSRADINPYRILYSSPHLKICKRFIIKYNLKL